MLFFLLFGDIPSLSTSFFKDLDYLQALDYPQGVDYLQGLGYPQGMNLSVLACMT
jgi:hypothetical protein